MECTEGLAFESDAVGRRSETKRRGDHAGVDVGEPGGGEDGFDRARGAEAERPGLPGGGGWKFGAAADDADRDGEEPVAVRGGVDDGGDAPARAAARGAWR